MRTTTTCAQCNKGGVVGKELYACTRCHGSFYCNTTCQRQHYSEHKRGCREYSDSYLHCATCNRTVGAKACTTCYKVAVCDSDECGDKHRAGQACVAPPGTTEFAVVADVDLREDGVLVMPCQDSVAHPATMNGLLTMLMTQEKIPFLIDRVYLVYVRCGGTGTVIPDSAGAAPTFPENFPCEGPLLGVTFSNRAEYKACADGMWRTRAITVHIVPGGGGPAFDMAATLPVSVGRNLLKVQIAIIPVEHTGPSRDAGCCG
jgi:hypothetical protein